MSKAFYKPVILANFILLVMLCWFIKQYDVKPGLMFNLNMVILIISFNIFLVELKRET
jgi:hypothetical protein